MPAVCERHGTREELKADRASQILFEIFQHTLDGIEATACSAGAFASRLGRGVGSLRPCLPVLFRVHGADLSHLLCKAAPLLPGGRAMITMVCTMVLSLLLGKLARLLLPLLSQRGNVNKTACTSLRWRENMSTLSRHSTHTSRTHKAVF